MKVNLDHNVECIINKNYDIDKSVLKQIEQRRQLADQAQSVIKSILSEAPKAPTPPEESQNIARQTINNINYDYEILRRQLVTVQDLLAPLDALIDRMDSLIKRIDQRALSLIRKINSQIDIVSDAYDFQISSGCRCNLIWQYVGQSIGGYTPSGSAINYDAYIVVPNPALEIKTDYHGIKYYQKPSNRDYGYNITSTFNGTISIGTSTIAVVSSAGTANIQINDEIVDNLDNPVAFNIGNIPKVVGFGTTSILGITTSDYVNVSIGSSIISFVGLGVTTNIKVGNYIGFSYMFENNTKVVGFGTTTTTIIYNGPTGSLTSTTTVTSIILDKEAINSGDNELIGFGTYTEYPSIKISSSSNINLNGDIMFAIRKVEDVETNFDFTSNPLDPVKIGPMGTNELGYGHSAVYVKNGASSIPVLWREILREPEPNVGAGYTVYYQGVPLWPYDYVTGYAVPGRLYTFQIGVPPIYTTIPPTGINTSGPQCVSYGATIVSAENTLNSIKQVNETTAKVLIKASTSLRKIRDKYELKAWSYLQSSAYLRGQMNEIEIDVQNLESYDYESQ